MQKKNQGFISIHMNPCGVEFILEHMHRPNGIYSTCLIPCLRIAWQCYASEHYHPGCGLSRIISVSQLGEKFIKCTVITYLQEINYRNSQNVFTQQISVLVGYNMVTICICCFVYQVVSDTFNFVLV